ncbi:hypothetical protein HH310_28615 [Actinoplanes sp. TBRC 11911]|uniref:hypothetical protein n=1 Tax=Actinoplanes sp. TBRC 11911 TaxID=2729386 RepID=UPI00145E4A1E|nr:hypothetical protein [Actinoplanes sp. TBRC 11911]NMO55136.1 hypothetical protein [Actinoplanes sp. TBRC 11911]
MDLWGGLMAPFPILFFIFVEMLSMGAMLVHKGIMNATGQQTRPLNLSRRSLADLRRAHGRPANPAEADIHRRSADLMAALRFYQVAVDPRFTDWEIGNQLAVNAPRMMEQVIDAYGHLPLSPEREVAVQVLPHLSAAGPGSHRQCIHVVRRWCSAWRPPRSPLTSVAPPSVSA